MLRNVELPATVAGKLLLSAMPGSSASFEEDHRAIAVAEITTVVCLVPRDEIQRKAPCYAKAMTEGKLGWECHEFPIQDFRAAEESRRPELMWLAGDVADKLRTGK